MQACVCPKRQERAELVSVRLGNTTGGKKRKTRERDTNSETLS